MAWLVLIVSGVFEAAWANALSKVEGFTKPLPVVVFFVTVCISMGGLGWAMKYIPVGTAYAVWAGVGAVMTVVVATIRGAEPISVVKFVLIAVLISCIVGLKFVSNQT